MIFPPDFTYPEGKTLVASLAAARIAGLVSARRAVVQAGGCSGLWPLALAGVFGHVYTFEPHPTNFQYLAANVAATPTITAFASALGETRAQVGLTRPKAKAGCWRVDGEGDIPMVSLDDVLGDVAIDALVLDVEGSEVPALHGAARLIAAHRPLLWCECLQHTAAIEAVFAAYGYSPPTRGIGGDWYSVHSSRVAH